MCKFQLPPSSMKVFMCVLYVIYVLHFSPLDYCAAERKEQTKTRKSRKSQEIEHFYLSRSATCALAAAYYYHM